LAQSDVSVTILGRNQARGDEVVAEMKAKGKGEHAFVQCDASLLANAASFAADYAKSHDKLDYLVLTQGNHLMLFVCDTNQNDANGSAGIATVQGYTPTSEQLDMKLSLHYYSRATFADQLGPLLSKSDDGRVLSVLSGGTHSSYAGYETDPDLSKSYSLKGAADATGFYNDIAADKLSQKYPKCGVIFNSFHFFFKRTTHL
jgi:hypothetical protein